MVKPKKHLGQHFLNDKKIAFKIVDALKANNVKKILEIGAGMGVLTEFLLEKKHATYVIEIDKESINYLERHFIQLQDKIIDANFLKFDLSSYFNNEQIAIIGNFPYNISSQILFQVIKFKEFVPEVVGMFQKEVAMRIASPPGNKTYGILSVFIQAYYNVEYLFTVDETVFTPPPKVKSGVLRLTRKENIALDCNEKLFFRIVKAGFNQRRKTLRNSLQQIIKKEFATDDIFNQRPEQLSVEEFIYLTNLIEKNI